MPQPPIHFLRPSPADEHLLKSLGFDVPFLEFDEAQELGTIQFANRSTITLLALVGESGIE